MSRQEQRRRRFGRAAGATLIALVLWVIISLSEMFTWWIDVPLTVNLPGEVALATPVPDTIRMRIRTDGWTLMQMLVGSSPRCVITPRLPEIEQRAIVISEQQIRNGTRLPSSVRIDEMTPGSLRLAIGSIVSKRVPLYSPGMIIATREGFKVIGQAQTIPDSVAITGAPSALEAIDRWYTEPLELSDVYRPVRESVPVNDTLSNVVEVEPRFVTVVADVQELAEKTFEELPVINRGRWSDTTVRLVMRPERIKVVLRGGVRDLDRLDPHQILSWVDLRPGRDTTGVVRPRISVPGGENISVLSITPERLNYLWRRKASGATAPIQQDPGTGGRRAR